jgi:PAS domain S-box-containing protein
MITDAHHELEVQPHLDEEHQRQALRGARLCAWHWNLRANTVTWDAEGRRLFGLTEGPPQRTTEEFFSRIHPEDRPRLQALVERAMRQKGPYRAEYRILLPDGSVRWIAGMGRPVVGPSGEVEHFFGVGMDITEPAPESETVSRGEQLLAQLSRRERDVLHLILQGLPNREVAARLHISPKTVETHRSHINQKLDVHSAAELFRLAGEYGLLPRRS